MLMFILLCGLRELGLLCFNTSHVNVYRRGLLLIFATQSSFNTSYVNVYHMRAMFIVIIFGGFNTSYVNVYRAKGMGI